VLDELTRGAVAEALGTSGMQLSEQLRSATEERLRTQQEATEAQSRAAQDVLRQLVEPLTKGVEKLDTQVRALEQARADAYGRLHEQVTATATTLEALQTATGQLDRAMRSNQVRGQWGELQLQRIVELVGLKEHVSYEQQVQQAATGTGRPDLTVHLTDGKVLYVDAKAPMAAFLRAIEEDDRDRSASISRSTRRTCCCTCERSRTAATSTTVRRSAWSRSSSPTRPRSRRRSTPTRSCSAVRSRCASRSPDRPRSR
jgi:DNA recombination protein RmuC